MDKAHELFVFPTAITLFGPIQAEGLPRYSEGEQSSKSRYEYVTVARRSILDIGLRAVE
jgi:hypothetical protein